MSPSLPRILRIPPMTRHAALRAMLAASLALMLGACASHSGVRDDAPPPPVGGTPADVVPDPVGDATAPAQLPADDTIEATISTADESLPTVAPQRSEEHTSELQSLLRTSYVVF